MKEEELFVTQSVPALFLRLFPGKNSLRSYDCTVVRFVQSSSVSSVFSGPG